MTAFTVNLADLQFILDQIKIAEAHAGGQPLSTLIPDPHVPWGLRTVDGTYNNIVEGRETWGAADTIMPRALQSRFLNDADGDQMPLGPGAPVITNNNYGTIGGSSGSVADADPRLISNLVVDMSLNNPAAIAAALSFAGNTENIHATIAEIVAARDALNAARAAAPPTTPAQLALLQAAVDSAEAITVARQAELAVAQEAEQLAQAEYDDAVQAEAAAELASNAADANATSVLQQFIGGTATFEQFTAAAAAAQAAQVVEAQAEEVVEQEQSELTAVETALTQAQLAAANAVAEEAAAVAALQAGQTAGETNPGVVAAKSALDAVLEEHSIVIENGSLVIPNVAPDEGLSAPFNTWMTFFGQFFDHGLDLISKGGNGTIYIPLAADDPLVTHGADGIAGTGDEVRPESAFMVLTRSTPVGATHEARNTTTSFVDQNQTYTSHASHQVFLREYETVEGKSVATGRLLNGADGGLPTWAEVKEQALQMLGIELKDTDVLNVPLLRTDPYGRFIPDPVTGYAQVIVGLGVDGIPNTADDVVASGSPSAALDLDEIGAIRTSHAFLDDIAHNAVPKGLIDHDRNPFTPMIEQTPDADNVAGNAITPNNVGVNLTYDNELLDAHYITGDGRGNENIGLTAVHHIFHAEHNRQIDAQKLTLLRDGDVAFINEWLNAPLAELPANFSTMTALEQLAYANTLTWDGERLFQAARFVTEMQYQHLVFEEFARKVQPAIDIFVFNNITDVNPAIFAEFAHTVYRFGHSMLTENIALTDPNGMQTEVGLIESFLNPIAFAELGQSAEEAAGAIIRGMTTIRGNEIDEFITGALRNNLLGLPLDLAAINIARGRDTGIPSLNDARTQLYAASGSTFLEPYDNWIDFASNLKNPASVINFIAAYGTHESITEKVADPTAPGGFRDKTSAEKRDAASALVLGVPSGTATQVPADRDQFLRGTGDWEGDETGLNLIDLWIGGLAEKKMPFGGMLGSTFNAIFELQLENLQDGDRLYYLTRTQGQNMLNMLEQNSFAKLIMANTDIAQPGADGIRGTADDIVTRHIGVDVFADYDYVLEVAGGNQLIETAGADGILLDNPDTLLVDERADNVITNQDPEGNDPWLQAMGLDKVSRDNLSTLGPDQNYLRFTGGEHIVVGGTNGNDTIITDFGDDGIWGDAGDDRIESGAGVDLVNGGAGNDVITDSGDTADFIKGDEGDDVIANSNGIDIVMGGTGQDVIFVGVDSTEVFAGEGNDFVAGGDGVDLLMGNEGDDWLEGAGGFDTIAGDNSDLFFDSKIQGHDVMFAGNEEMDFDSESGDDIMVQGESVIRNEGMFGFDWATFQGMAFGGNADLNVPIFTTEQADILRNRFDKVEALSGWQHNDVLTGDNRVAGVPDPAAVTATTEGIFFNDELTQSGVNRIAGLYEVLGLAANPSGPGDPVVFTGGNILLGGGGSDTLQGNGGNDILDGDKWLNVRIRISAVGVDNQIATVDSLRHVFAAGEGPDAWNGKSLSQLMIDRVIEPSQLHIVREILDAGIGSPQSVDTAIFRGNRSEYTIVTVGGVTTVTHNTDADPLTGANDGVDTLRNVERLQFADQVFELVEGLNEPAEGQPEIVGVAQFGQQLSLRLNDDGSLFGVTDADNISLTNPDGAIRPPFTVEWQIETDPGVYVDTGGRGLTFTPVADGVVEGDVRVRAIVRYTDAAAIPGSVASVPTVPLIPPFNLTATEGDDVLVGTPGNDLIDALGGDDIVFALGGNDTIIGGNGNDILDGGEGEDTAVFEGDIANFTFEFNADNQLEVIDAARGEEDAVTNIEIFRFDGNVTRTIAQVLAGLPTPATENADIIIGTAGDDDIDALGGNDNITALGGSDTITGGLGNDLIDAGADDDRIFWDVGDGRDTIEGGAGTDEIRIGGSADDETYFVEEVLNYTTRTGGTVAANTDIVISRRVGAVEEVVAELNGIEEIDINGGGGTDTFVVSGNFANTDLNLNTITLNGTTGNETFDITGLGSAHRVVIKSNGGNDTIVGTLRPQDVIELPAGATYTASVTNNVKTLSNGSHSISFANGGTPTIVGAVVGGGGGSEHFTLTASDLAGLKALVSGQALQGGDDDDVPSGVRALSGHGNNDGHANWGAADTPFIRLTDAHYGAYDATTGNRAINPLFDGLDARNISNILSAQEADLPKNQEGGNIFLMAFGQYVDHGLDFLPKGGNGVIEIGGPGSGHSPGTNNPADLTRGSVVAGTGSTTPQHLNKTSAFVDQNQAYGSNALVGQFLRQSDGDHGVGSHLLAGVTDPGNVNFKLLPTLRELIQHHWQNDTIFEDASLPGGSLSFRTYAAGFVGSDGTILNTDAAKALIKGMSDNFMGSSHALLLDTNPYVNLLEHFVAGDGRANENVALTSIHTIWARNHNFHVDNLEAAGFQGTPEELFQAAKMLNEAEYQRVVFDEFADSLLGGMKGTGSHGHDDYNPNADASISHEFAAAVYRVGHSLISQNLTVIGADGQPKQVALFDAFLNPTNEAGAFTAPLPPGYVPQPGFEQLGANSVIAGTITQAAEAVDFNIVDAVRNDLVRINADLAAFNIARGRDVGLGTLNQVRADLQASSDPYIREAVGFAGNLNPYTSWDDFKTRNGLSQAVINQFKLAYPDLILRTAAEIAAFTAANPDITLFDSPESGAGAKRVQGIDRVDLWVGGLAEAHVNGGMVGQTFWVVLHEQFDRLQEADRFYYTDRFDNFDLYENIIDGQNFTDIIARNTGLTSLPERVFEVDDEDDASNNDDDEDNDGDDDDDVDENNSGSDDEDDEDNSGNDDEDDDEDNSGNDDEDEDDDDGQQPAPNPGTGGSALPFVVYLGVAGGGTGVGGALGDILSGLDGADALFGMGGDDSLVGHGGNDNLVAGDGNDLVFGDDGNDTVLAGAGDDTVFGGNGNDTIWADAGNDRITGGEGSDVIDAGDGNDTIYASLTDGSDVISGGAGADTIDYQAITAALTINLGANGSGSASSAQSGNDALNGIENVKGGTGNDTITASNAHNVLDGGLGDDTFVFNSAAAADGDRIDGFTLGDTIDLTPFMPAGGTFVANNATFNLAGQVKLVFVGEDTRVDGNTDTDGDVDFSILVSGRHLTGNDFA